MTVLHVAGHWIGTSSVITLWVAVVVDGNEWQVPNEFIRCDSDQRQVLDIWRFLSRDTDSADVPTCKTTIILYCPAPSRGEGSVRGRAARPLRH